MKANKLIIILLDVLLTCTVVFSQDSSASWPSAGEIANDALKIYRAYGLGEIPQHYWTDVIKKLKPVKLYSHSSNVVIVLKDQDGVEEGIWVGNLISSYVRFTGCVIDSEGFEFSREEGGLTFKRYKRPAPRFEEYPIADIFAGTPVSPKVISPYKQDIEKIQNGVEKGMGVFRGKEEKKGANFAGHFILIKWISDSPSLRIAIVDAITGEVFAPPDTTSLYRLQSLTYPGDTQKNAEVQFRLDSNLLIIKNNSGVCPYISYYLLKENRWELLKKEPLQRTEFPYFKMAN